MTGGQAWGLGVALAVLAYYLHSIDTHLRAISRQLALQLELSHPREFDDE